MGRNTRQTNPIEELQTCSDEHAIHNKFRSIAISRNVQATFVRPVFDAVVSKHIRMVILPAIQELKTESAAALSDPEASLGTQKSFVSPSISDVIRTGSLSTLLVSIPVTSFKNFPSFDLCQSRLW